jgi:hypothetical protein
MSGRKFKSVIFRRPIYNNIVLYVAVKLNTSFINLKSDFV